MIWYYTFGVNCKYKFSRSHAHLLYFVKDPEQLSRSTPKRSASPRPASSSTPTLRANPKGRLPDDTWILRPQDVPGGFDPLDDTWYVPRVCGTFKERAGWHGCQMPEQLLGRIIKSCSNPGDLVLDPFAGSGTSLTVARKLHRRYLGFELSPEYAERARARLEACEPGQALEGAEEPSVGARPKRVKKHRKPAPGLHDIQ